MFERKFPNFSKPIKLGNTVFRNRMFSAPMGGTDITDDCSVGPRTIGFYELRAKGGAAAVTASELVVHPQTDASHMFHFDLKVPGNLAAWTFLADAVNRHGAVSSVELSHSGQYAGTYLVDKDKKREMVQYGPCDWTRPDGIKVKALTKEQIEDIIKSYGEVATLVKRAGFGMVMIHAGHGWLLNQFLSPHFNHRDDEYGGSFENRLKIVIEVLKEVRKAVGIGFPIELRMSGSELFEGGYTIEDGIKIAKAVEEYVDLIHVSAGSYQFGFFNTHPPMFAPHGVNVHLAAEIKKHVTKPVATIGALNKPEEMEEIISSGKADVVYMARALLADPYLPRKVMANEQDEIIHCLRCFACMAERPVTGTRRCTVNPLIGREIEGLDIIPAIHKKKVVVVGAGVGGLRASITAKQRGHEVILLEKSDAVGGILKSEQGIPFKYEMYRLGLSLEKLALKEAVDIRLNTNATPELVSSLNPDAVIIAIGSSPLVPPIKGLDGENVITVNDLYLKHSEVKNTVVVLGAGLSGCEAVVHMALEGKKVSLVEMTDALAKDCNIRNRPILLKKVEESGTAYIKHKAVEVVSNGVHCLNENGEQVFIEGDTIICATGQRANSDLADTFLDTAPFVRKIGDCIRPSTIMNAVYNGHHAALDI